MLLYVFHYLTLHNNVELLSYQLHNHSFLVFNINRFSDIAPVISFFLEMVYCYFKILKLFVILILIYKHYHLKFQK